MTKFIEIPRIEDEIEEAWQEFAGPAATADDRAFFEAGFRAARTFTQTGMTATLGVPATEQEKEHG